MKKNKLILSFLIALAISQLSNAQIVLNNTDLPKSGDIQISYIVESAQALTTNPGNAGENVEWDFRNLTSQTSDTLSWIDANTTTSYSQFPLATLALNTACTKVHSHVTHTDIATCKNNFYIKNNSGLSYYGSDVQTISKYDIPRNIFPLLKYGDSINNESRFIYYSDGNTEKVLHIKGYSKAEAWGTLTTPTGSVSAIRIYTSETVYDSTYTNGIVTLATKKEGNYYYKWYTKGLGYPVLQISKGVLSNNNLEVKYAAKPASISTDIQQVSTSNFTATLYPNPIKDKAILKLSSNFPTDNYTFSIYDFYGRTISKLENHSGNEIVIESNSLKQGTYFYQLLGKNTSIKGKFIVLK